MDLEITKKIFKLLNQSQKITINMQMQKSLEILQLSYSEMIEKINNELENNPLLEPESNKEKKNLYNIKSYTNNKDSNSKSKYIENTLEKNSPLFFEIFSRACEQIT